MVVVVAVVVVVVVLTIACCKGHAILERCAEPSCHRSNLVHNFKKPFLTACVQNVGNTK
jgi:hypothetical protein